MELTQILIIAGVIGGIILAIIAIRGSFRNDDAFYGESPTVPTHGSGEATPPPASPDDQGRVDGD